MNNNTLSKFTFFKKSLADEIVNALKQNGIVVIPNYFSRDQIQNLNLEVTHCFDQLEPKDQCIIENFTTKRTPSSYMAGKVIRIMPNSYSLFPSIKKMLIEDRWIRQVIDLFYGMPNKKFMQTFVTHDTIIRNEEWEDGMNHNAGLHFDPYQSIKVATYLQNTDRGNGAFKIIPGSQKEGSYFRKNLKPTIWKDKQILDCFTPFKDSKHTAEEVVYIEALAGDLIIFDTDCWHGGGEVLHSGKERKFIICHNRRV